MPIIDDKLFKAALLDVLEDEPDYKRATEHRNDAWSTATAQYYAPEIEHANNALKTLRDNAADRIKRALEWKQRRALLGTLGARLEYYAWQYHCALAPGNHNVRPAPTSRQVLDLHHGGFPFLARQALTTINDQFIAYITDVANHVDADWDDINHIFFPGWDLIELEEIMASGSDSHKQGKSVVFLVFKGQRPAPPAAAITCGTVIRNLFTRPPTRMFKLVYKPSDMSLDYMLVGDTQTVAAQNPGGLPNPAGGSLFENINGLITAGQLHADATFTGAHRPNPVLPVYPILPRNAGNVTTAYGYIKFLAHLPKPRATNGGFTVNFPGNEAEWDWITTSNDVLIDYYRLFGWYIAIGLNFGIADAHNQNLLVHDKKPYLIDMEISFKWRCESVGNTGLQDVMSSPGPSKKGDRCHIYYKNGNACQRTTGARAAACINAGITEAFDLFARDPGNALQTWLNSHALAGALARYTPKLTRAYGEALRAAYVGGADLPNGVHPACLAPMPNPGAGVPFHEDFRFEAGIRAWYNGQETEHRPNYAMACPLHDWRDYLNCDYPAYYRVLNSMDLLNARGQAVQIAAPAHPGTVAPLPHNDPAIHANRNRTIAGPHYFDHYPAIYRFEVEVTTLEIHRFNVNVSTFVAPAGTIAHLNGNAIADLRASFAAANPVINLTVAATEATVTNDREWRITDGGRTFRIRRNGVTNEVRVYEARTIASLNGQVIDALTASFAAANPAIILALDAEETTETDNDKWRIINNNSIFHIRRVEGTNVVKVYEADTAIAMVQRQYELLRTVQAFRDRLRNDAIAYVNRVYPRPTPPANYNGF